MAISDKELDNLFGAPTKKEPSIDDEMDALFGPAKKEKTSVKNDLKAGVVQAAGALSYAARDIKRRLPFTANVSEKNLHNQVEENKKNVSNFLGYDPTEDIGKNPGVGGNVLRMAPQIGSVLATAALNPPLAVGLGLGMAWGESNNLKNDLISQGVDNDTAQRIRNIQFGSNALGNLLPVFAPAKVVGKDLTLPFITKELTKKATAAGAVNATQGAVTDLMSERTLFGRGYADQSKMFDAGNTEMRLAEFLVGGGPVAARGAYGYRRDQQIAKTAEKKLDTLRNLSQNTPLSRKDIPTNIVKTFSNDISIEGLQKVAPKKSKTADGEAVLIQVPRNFVTRYESDNNPIYISEKSVLGKAWLDYIDRDARDTRNEKFKTLTIEELTKLKENVQKQDKGIAKEIDEVIKAKQDVEKRLTSDELPLNKFTNPEEVIKDSGYVEAVDADASKMMGLAKPTTKTKDAPLPTKTENKVLEEAQNKEAARVAEPTQGELFPKERIYKKDAEADRLLETEALRAAQDKEAADTLPNRQLELPLKAPEKTVADLAKEAKQQQIQKQKNTAKASRVIDFDHPLNPFLSIKQADVIPTIESLPKKQQDISKSFYTNNLEAGPRMVALKTNHPLVKYWNNIVTSAVNDATSWIRHNVFPLGDKWTSLSEAERTEVMFVAKEADKRGQDFSVQELTAAGYTKKQIDFLEEFRIVGDKLYDRLVEANQASPNAAAIPYRRGWTPGRFRGDYTSFVVKNTDKGPEIIGIVKANSRAEHKKAVEAYKKLYKDEKISFTQRKRISLDDFNNLKNLDSEITRLLSFAKDADIEQRHELDQQLAQEGFALARAMFGVDQHELFKKGIIGAEGNKPWKSDVDNAKEYFQSFIEYVDEATFNSSYRKVLPSVKQLLGDEKIKALSPNAAAYVRRNLNALLGYRLDGVFGQVGKIVDNIVDLAANAVGVGPTSVKNALSINNRFWQATHLNTLRFFIVNAMQPLFSGKDMMYYVANKYSPLPVPETMRNFSLGYLDFLKILTNGVVEPFTKRGVFKDPELQRVYNYMEDNNILSTVGAETLEDVAKNPMSRRTDNILMMAPKLSELFSRPPIYLGMYRSFKRAGLDENTALHAAYEATQAGMVDYHDSHAPLFSSAGGIAGEQALRLKKYIFGIYSNYDLYARTDKKALAVALGTIGLFAGLRGMPGYDFVNEAPTVLPGVDETVEELFAEDVKRISKDLFKYATGQDPEDFLSKNSLEFLALSGKYGLISASLNLDLTSSLGLGNAAPSFADLKDNPISSTMSYLGSSVDTFQEMSKFVINDFQYDHMMRTIRTVIPGQFKRNFDNANYIYTTPEGVDIVKDRAGNLTSIELDKKDKQARSYGFRTLSEAVKAENQYKQNKTVRLYLKNLEKDVNQIRNMFESREYTEEEIKTAIENMVKRLPENGKEEAQKAISFGLRRNLREIVRPEHYMLLSDSPIEREKWIQTYGKFLNKGN
ncbi:hypothetical protein [Microcystis sp. M42BS1]|uniref:hypothetical protein n=1 Tax=Microcystis sp. M42BS1 TaxID=2771192 RepID=UPI0025880D83|nr:hypothetical protein [Microcystis sp. M42BS1]MCA2570646.1 hypothetical protein [Microcystis sp. M42BS1]